MKQILFVILLFTISPLCLFAQTPFSVNDLLNVKRVGDPQLSPDGRTVAYTVGVVNKSENRLLTHIYTVHVDGSGKRQVTSGDKSHSSPRWSPDGKRLAYTTGGQVWTMETDGDDKKQITKIATGAGNPVWSPNGTWLAFSSDVYPECRTIECNKTEEEKSEASKVKAKIADRLLFRHWVEWRDRKRSHVYIIPSKGGIARDMTPGDFDSP
ncbi:MAG: hypothetical protein WBD22_14400, partial [Pyrinomonadaceae bacterium]